MEEPQEPQPNPAGPQAPTPQQQAQQLQAQQRIRDPLFNIQSRLFHTLFHRLTLTYARACPRPVRRIIETMFLMKAMLCFFMLVYIHITFARRPVQCLESYKDLWPRDGILRVEVIRDFEEDPSFPYTVEQSYEKERKMQLRMRQREQVQMTPIISLFSTQGVMTDFFDSPSEPEGADSGSEKASNVTNTSQEKTNETLIQNLTIEATTDKVNQTTLAVEDQQEEDLLPDEELDPHFFGFMEEEYIVEYSLEYGFLRLSPATRKKLNVSVMMVVLDPSKNSCFGDSFSLFILQEFLGFDNILMSSIKGIAESENSNGYLRNVVTGAHYHFVSRSDSSASYILAGIVMIVFTVGISMLLRFSQHQIFVFIIELLQMLEFNAVISFPIASLVTVILALVGMEAVMSEFFEDTTTAFYIIVIVWIADQYNAICCHTNISAKFWPRFFYLYHFSFYAYHYRFSGQYSGLALLTMWLFTQHSMIYFFHHYELPIVLQQAHIQELLMQNNQNGMAAPGPVPRPGGQRQANNLIRPQMRGFSIWGIRFRFGVTFQNGLAQNAMQLPPQNNNPGAQEQQEQQQEQQPQEQQQQQQPATEQQQQSPDIGNPEPAQIGNPDLQLRPERDPQEASSSQSRQTSDNNSDKASDDASQKVEDLRSELVQHSGDLREMQSELGEISTTLRHIQRDEEEEDSDNS